jgi:hypothetical protein
MAPAGALTVDAACAPAPGADAVGAAWAEAAGLDDADVACAALAWLEDEDVDTIGAAPLPAIIVGFATPKGARRVFGEKVTDGTRDDAVVAAAADSLDAIEYRIRMGTAFGFLAGHSCGAFASPIAGHMLIWTSYCG